LNPASGTAVWVDLAAPSIPESLVLSETFGFHPLAVEDAMSERMYPKVEPYDGFLYVVLHSVKFQSEAGKGFRTHDTDFFLGRNYLVTVHDGSSRSILDVKSQCIRNHSFLGDGPVALFHRIVDRMVESYAPEVETLQEALGLTEDEIFSETDPDVFRQILRYKRDLSALRRIALPQRDVIGRLARREFVDIGTEVAFRFRDVYDQLVRIADESLMMQDRITGMLEAYLSNTSNRLNQITKLLAAMATLFLPLTVLTGLYGMNVALPEFPGGDAAQFWWLVGIMVLIVAVMLVAFRRVRWI
jgi:magnesium transporter